MREARARGVRVTAEVTPHHFSLTDEVIHGFDSAAKMAPPLRDEANRLALLEGLRDGTISAIASDHAPHYEAETQREFDAVPFGIVGLETAVSLALDRLVGQEVLTLPEMIAKFTSGPREILGLPHGTLKEGAPGDVTILDPGARDHRRPGRLREQREEHPLRGLEAQGVRRRHGRRRRGADEQAGR